MKLPVLPKTSSRPPQQREHRSAVAHNARPTGRDRTVANVIDARKNELSSLTLADRPCRPPVELLRCGGAEDRPCMAEVKGGMDLCAHYHDGRDMLNVLAAYFLKHVHRFPDDAAKRPEGEASERKSARTGRAWRTFLEEQARTLAYTEPVRGRCRGQADPV